MSLNYSIIDEVTIRNKTVYFFGALCIGSVVVSVCQLLTRGRLPTHTPSSPMSDTVRLYATRLLTYSFTYLLTFYRAA